MKFIVSICLFALFVHSNVIARPTDYIDDNPEHGQFFQGDMEGVELEYDSKGAAQLITGTRTQWPGGVVPYVFDANAYNDTELGKIYDGMRFLENAVMINGKYCVRFTPRTNEANWIRIYNGTGCSAIVGKSSTSGAQNVSLKKPTTGSTSTCLTTGIVAHELIHTLGFHHEQSRPDRDDYVTILFENINPGSENNFIKYTTTIDLLGLPYDYESIMHYSETTFALPGTKTIVPRVQGVTIGQRVRLSSIDIAEIRKYFNCS